MVKVVDSGLNEEVLASANILWPAGVVLSEDDGGSRTLILTVCQGRAKIVVSLNPAGRAEFTFVVLPSERAEVFTPQVLRGLTHILVPKLKELLKKHGVECA